MPTFTTILSILSVALPTTVWLYSFWVTSKKDGFDQERALDLVGYGILGGLVLGFIVSAVSRGQFSFSLQDVNPYAAIFGFVSCCSLVALSYRWSLYRVLDNLATSFVLAAAFWLMVMFISNQFKISYAVACVGLFGTNLVLQKYRPSLIKSGMWFSLIAGAFCLAAFLLLPRDLNLIFVGLLFTLSQVVLIFRLRSIYGKSKSNASTPHTV